MPRYTTSQTYTEGNTQVVTLAESKALVTIPENSAPVVPPEEEDLEVKLRRITELVPVRISNTSGSSAGSGSGDFHQYRQMRRREQDRLARMEVDYQRRKEQSEFAARQAARLKEAEERTAKKRAKRQKKKEKKKQKRSMESEARGKPGTADVSPAAATAAAGGEESSDSEAEE